MPQLPFVANDQFSYLYFDVIIDDEVGIEYLVFPKKLGYECNSVGSIWPF